MSARGSAYVVGAFEHPARKVPNRSIAQLHFEVTRGALDDAGLQFSAIESGLCDAALVLLAGVGKLPINTDGGGLCNNHLANRGGITKVIEAVRQLRGEAHPAVKVDNCDLALTHGAGLSNQPARMT